MYSFVSLSSVSLPPDVGMLLRESFFCGAESGSVLTCCPKSGVLGEDEARSGLLESEGQCQLQVCWSIRLHIDDQSLQDGGGASCVTYTSCRPFHLMLGNLRKPFPSVGRWDACDILSYSSFPGSATDHEGGFLVWLRLVHRPTHT